MPRLKVQDEREKDTIRSVEFYEMNYSNPGHKHWLNNVLGKDAYADRFPDVIQVSRGGYMFYGY